MNYPVRQLSDGGKVKHQKSGYSPYLVERITQELLPQTLRGFKTLVGFLISKKIVGRLPEL